MFQMNPEFRSLTALCVVEDLSKCPLGYSPITKTHDHDSEADLWKNGFFGSRVTRYVCTSKSQGRPEHVITAIQIIGEREMPPEGFSIVANTVDTNQRAFQKKQLCYKLTHFRTNAESIIDIIILTKLKPPMGYDNVGDINGMHICVRKVSAITRLSSPSLSYGIIPGMGNNAGGLYPQLQQPANDLTMNTNGGNSNGYNPGMSGPSPDRFSAPATSSPALYPGQFANKNVNPPSQFNNFNTLSFISELEGVPLNLREDLIPKNGEISFGRGQVKPVFPIKSEAELEQEYAYDWSTERLVINGSL